MTKKTNQNNNIKNYINKKNEITTLVSSKKEEAYKKYKAACDVVNKLNVEYINLANQNLSTSHLSPDYQKNHINATFYIETSNNYKSFENELKSSNFNTYPLNDQNSKQDISNKISKEKDFISNFSQKVKNMINLLLARPVIDYDALNKESKIKLQSEEFEDGLYKEKNEEIRTYRKILNDSSQLEKDINNISQLEINKTNLNKNR